MHSQLAFILGAALIITMPHAQQVGAERATAEFSGRVNAGQRYDHRFGPDFVFSVLPNREDAHGHFYGWDLVVTRVNERVNLAQFTVPFGGPRSESLFASYFLPGVNAPGKERVLAFSPEVGRTITLPMIYDTLAPDHAQLIDRIYDFGSINFTVRDLSIRRTSADDAVFDWVDFAVVASWPKTYKPADYK